MTGACFRHLAINESYGFNFIELFELHILQKNGFNFIDLSKDESP